MGVSSKDGAANLFCIPQILTDSHNVNLYRPVTEEEIEGIV